MGYAAAPLFASQISGVQIVAAGASVTTHFVGGLTSESICFFRGVQLRFGLRLLLGGAQLFYSLPLAAMLHFFISLFFCYLLWCLAKALMVFLASKITTGHFVGPCLVTRVVDENTIDVLRPRQRYATRVCLLSMKASCAQASRETSLPRKDRGQSACQHVREDSDAYQVLRYQALRSLLEGRMVEIEYQPFQKEPFQSRVLRIWVLSLTGERLFEATERLGLKPPST